MAEIVNLIQEEQLFGVHWDTQPMGKVLKEILTLFQDQSKRISKIENQISSFVEKASFEKLGNSLLDLEGKSTEEFERIKKENKETKDKIFKEIESVKDYVDNNNLTAISESRRLITNEISNYVPKVFENDPVIMKVNESIKENANSIKKLKDDFDSITIQPSTPGDPITLDRSAVRVIQCEKKIAELESVVQNYPSLESELLNIQLQFPNSIQKLERKINDIQTALESKINLKITPAQSSKDSSGPSSNQNSLPATPNKPKSNGGSAISSFVKVDKSDPPLEIEFDNSILQPSQKVVMPDILPDLRPNPLLDKIKFEEKERKNKEMIELIKSIPSNSHNQPSFKDENFEIETLPNDQVVKIYETHTHVSELQSSVRVVSELEWCTQAINQHHDAIRQIQQSLRTQQDNFDTITENLMRVNSTNNTRISQLAQQNLHQNQDIDELRRQVSDQLNKLQIHIYKLQQRLNDGDIDLSNVLKKNEDDGSKKDSNISPSSSLLNKKTVLPPLSSASGLNGKIGNDSEFLSSDGDDQSNDDKNKKNAQNQDDKKGKDDKKDDKEKDGPKKHNFTICTTHFTVNALKCKAQTIFSTIGSDLIIPSIDNFDPNESNDKKSHNRIDHIDLYSSTIKQTIQKPSSSQVFKTKNDYGRPFGGTGASGRSGKEDDEFYSSRPAESSKLNKGPIIYGDIINLGRPYSQRQEMMYPSGLEALGLSDAEITEMIEDKVSMVARKTIAILADHAKEKMNEQAREVKKSIDHVISLVDGKIDRDFVERMFNKFRVMVNEMNEKIDNLQCSFLEWVTRDELEMVLQKFISIVTDVKDAAATKAKYNCLLCGRPRQHLAGMMIGNVLPKNLHDDASPSKQKLPKTVPPTAMKPTRKISTGFQQDEINDKRKRGQTALGNQHQQVPRDVVQFLTTS